MPFFSFFRRRSRAELLGRIDGVLDQVEMLQEEIAGVRTTLDGILAKACSDVDVARVVEDAVASRLPERGTLEGRLQGIEGRTADVAREIGAARSQSRAMIDQVAEEGREWVGRQLDDKLGALRDIVDRQGGRVVETVAAAARRAEEAASSGVRDVRADLARARESTSQDLAGLRSALTEAQSRWAEEFAHEWSRLRTGLDASAALLRDGLREVRDPGAGRGFLGRILARFAPAPRVGRIAEGLAILEAALGGIEGGRDQTRAEGTCPASVPGAQTLQIEGAPVRCLDRSCSAVTDEEVGSAQDALDLAPPPGGSD